MLRDILQKKRSKSDTRKVLAYDHFGVIFDGTPSFAEVEVRECIWYLLCFRCHKPWGFARIRAHSPFWQICYKIF
jgi:hypothetical protein